MKFLASRKGYTIADLEKITGIAKGYLNLYQVYKPRQDKLDVLVKALDTSEEYLLTGKINY